jgi:hypothetical protein
MGRSLNHSPETPPRNIGARNSRPGRPLCAKFCGQPREYASPPYPNGLRSHRAVRDGRSLAPAGPVAVELSVLEFSGSAVTLPAGGTVGLHSAERRSGMPQPKVRPGLLDAAGLPKNLSRKAPSLRDTIPSRPSHCRSSAALGRKESSRATTARSRLCRWSTFIFSSSAAASFPSPTLR